MEYGSESLNSSTPFLQFHHSFSIFLISPLTYSSCLAVTSAPFTFSPPPTIFQPSSTLSLLTSPHLDQLSLSYHSIQSSKHTQTHTHFGSLSGLAFPGVNQACPQQPLPFHLQHPLTFPDTQEGREQRHSTHSFNCSISAVHPLTPVLSSFSCLSISDLPHVFLSAYLSPSISLNPSLF